MNYFGVQSCAAAYRHYGGQNACPYGCLGYGDCKDICPSNAICMQDGIARIITSKCTGCNLCVKICPSKLITLECASVPVIIACNSIEKGAVVRKKCSVGCIACTKCVKECPDAAITMVNNLAVIDYGKCSGCGKCVDVCITKSIRFVKG